MNKCLLLLLPLLLLSLPVHAATINITVSNDTYVNQYYPTTNYGNSNSMTVKNQSTAIRNAFILFNFSDIPQNSTINSATLHLFKPTTAAGTKNISVYNVSPSWFEYNMTWNTEPVFISKHGEITTTNLAAWVSLDVTTLVSNRLASNNVSFGLSDNTSISGNIDFSAKETINGAYLEINFSYSDCGTSIIGSYCDMQNLDVDGRPIAIITTPDYTCQNDSYYTCPSGTICTQILPQVNITTPLVEDLVDCSRCWYQKMNVGTFTNPIWVTRYTNCEAYPQCDNCNGAFCYGNTFQSNLSTNPVSLDQYAAGCVNSVGTVINIILGNGTNTTVQNITDEIFPDANYTYNVTMPTCTNTSTTCYDINCIQVSCAVIVSDNYADQIALVIGSTVGVQDLATARTMSSLLMTMLGAAGVLVLFATMKIHGQILGQSFLISILMFLVLFTLIGWFPSWLMVILMVISGLMIAKTLKVF